MTVTIITPPAPLVTLDEAKTALGESGSDRDSLITGLILAAQTELDGPTGWVGCSVAEQTIEVRLDNFSEEIALPYGPVTAIGSVKYLDGDDAEQTLAASVYSLLGDGRVVLAPDQSWPALSTAAEAVRVTYDVGMDATADAGRIALMKAAIIMHVKMTLDMADPTTYRQTIKNLVQPLRTWGPA